MIWTQTSRLWQEKVQLLFRLVSKEFCWSTGKHTFSVKIKEFFAAPEIHKGGGIWWQASRHLELWGCALPPPVQILSIWASGRSFRRIFLQAGESKWDVPGHSRKQLPYMNVYNNWCFTYLCVQIWRNPVRKKTDTVCGDSFALAPLTSKSTSIAGLMYPYSGLSWYQIHTLRHVAPKSQKKVIGNRMRGLKESDSDWDWRSKDKPWAAATTARSSDWQNRANHQHGPMLHPHNQRTQWQRAMHWWSYDQCR